MSHNTTDDDVSEELAQKMNRQYGSSDVQCRRGCGDWSGQLRDAEMTDTTNGNGVNWMCPNCGALVGTANY